MLSTFALSCIEEQINLCSVHSSGRIERELCPAVRRGRGGPASAVCHQAEPRHIQPRVTGTGSCNISIEIFSNALRTQTEKLKKNFTINKLSKIYFFVQLNIWEALGSNGVMEERQAGDGAPSSEEPRVNRALSAVNPGLPNSLQMHLQREDRQLQVRTAP